jgi:hypothetical protein
MGEVMTGYQSKKAAALDEDGMYLVHHTQPAQEPVAWMYQSSDEFGWRDEIQFVQPPNHPVFRNVVALYTTPPQRPWVGLTPEEILDLFDLNNVYGSKWIEFARAVETKLKEKNT